MMLFACRKRAVSFNNSSKEVPMRMRPSFLLSTLVALVALVAGCAPAVPTSGVLRGTPADDGSMVVVAWSFALAEAEKGWFQSGPALVPVKTVVVYHGDKDGTPLYNPHTYEYNKVYDEVGPIVGGRFWARR